VAYLPSGYTYVAIRLSICMQTASFAVRSRLREFIRNIPDGSRITDDSFRARHRSIVVATAAFLPFIFGVSRMNGVESVTGAELPAIPLAHSVVGVVLVTALLGGAMAPTVPQRAKTALSSFAFMTIAALLAYYTGGFIEAHSVPRKA